MSAIETIGFFVTNAGATLTAVTASPGDTLAVRNPEGDAPIDLLAINGDFATAGELRVRSPRLHDQVNGIRLGVSATEARNLTGDHFKQKLFPQDNLIVEATSGGADSSAGTLAIRYDRIGGITQRLAAWAEIEPQIEDYMGVRNAFNTSGTIGTWAGEAINADNDQFVANRDYAVLGAEVGGAVTSVTWRGSDTGNVRVGMPGGTDRAESREYFVRKSLALGLPHIPIFNSANRGATLIEALDNAATTATTTNAIYALLRG